MLVTVLLGPVEVVQPARVVHLNGVLGHGNSSIPFFGIQVFEPRVRRDKLGIVFIQLDLIVISQGHQRLPGRTSKCYDSFSHHGACCPLTCARHRSTRPLSPSVEDDGSWSVFTIDSPNRRTISRTTGTWRNPTTS